MSGLATSGTLTHWFRDNLARDLDPATAMIALAAEAEAVAAGRARASSSSPISPASGRRSTIPHAKGVLFGLNLTHTRGDIYRALLEGIAYGTNHIFETYRRGRAATRSAVYAVGGGTKNRGLGAGDLGRLGPYADRPRQDDRRVLRRRLPCRARRRRRRDGDIRDWNPVASEVVADPANADVYARQYAVFKDIYARTHDLMRRLGE